MVDHPCDHLHADLREPRREAGWATAAVIRELETELEVTRTEAYRALHARNVLVHRVLQRREHLMQQLTGCLEAAHFSQAANISQEVSRRTAN